MIHFLSGLPERRRRSANFFGVVSVLLPMFSCLNISPVVTARELRVGDIVVAAQSSGELYAIDAVTGVVEQFSVGGLLMNPNHIVVDKLGRVVVTERDSPGRIVQTNPSTGEQIELATGPLLSYPVALTWSSAGNLVIGNHALGSPADGNTLVEVNLVTGEQTRITTLTDVLSIQDIDADGDAGFFLLDSGVFNGGWGKVVHYDRLTDVSTTITPPETLFNPSDLFVHSSGDLIVANRLATDVTQLLRINPSSGSSSLVTTLDREGWIASQDDEHLIYANFYTGDVSRVSLLTGQQSLLATVPTMWNLVGVAVVTAVPEPSTAALVSWCGVAAIRVIRRK